MTYHTWHHNTDGPSWLPVERILWYPTNSDHHNHLHVVGLPRATGTPPVNNPGISDSLNIILDALDEAWPLGYRDLGIYNRRPISGTTTWSQHSWSNAIDIGPYNSLEEQLPFYEFLTRKEAPMAFTDHEEAELRRLVAGLDAVDSNGGFSRFAVELIRKERQLPLHAAESGGGLTEADVRRIIADAISNG